MKLRNAPGERHRNESPFPGRTWAERVGRGCRQDCLSLEVASDAEPKLGAGDRSQCVDGVGSTSWPGWIILPVESASRMTQKADVAEIP